MKRFILASLAAASLAACTSFPTGSTEFGPRGGDHPYAKKAKGRPGFVISPYNDAALIDVRGFPCGTQVTDPWTGNIFLVP